MQNGNTNEWEELRRRAMEQVEHRDGDKQDLPDDLDEAIRKLEIHQEELEIQNEELKRANKEITELQQEYADLYELSPAGYVTLSPEGTINRINLSGVQLLDENRQALLYSTFSRFLTDESRSVYFRALNRVREEGKTEGIELELNGTRENGPVWVKTDVQADYSDAGELIQWRLTLTDISRRRQSEEELKDYARELEAIYTHLPVLLFLLDEERKIRKSNAYVAEFTATPQERLRGALPGEALQCVHRLDDPRGCGFGPHCRDCRVRNLLLNTLETGRSYDRQEVEVFVDGEEEEEQKLTFLLSTTVISRARERLVLLALEDISERKRQEEELSASEEKFRTIFESANDAIFIHDLEGRFWEVNEVACRNLGYSRKELLDKRVEDIDVHEYAPFISKRLEEVEHEKSTVFETVILRKDGTEVPVEVSARRFEYEHSPCILSVARDITERKKAQENLRMFRNQLLTILENQEAGVFVVSRRRASIIYANSYMKRLFSTDIIGARCHDVLGYKKEMCPFCPNLDSSSAGAPSGDPANSFEYYMPSMERWFMVNVRPIQWVDNSEATLNIFTDITAYKETEQLRDDIDQITRHDLKSPLNGILGAAQLIRTDESLSEEHREYGEMIEESGRNMLRLIDESLSLYKMEKGSYEMEPEKVDIEELLRHVIRDYEQRPEAKGVQIALESDASSGSHNEKTVRGEYLLCYSLFSNLVKNAVEASENGDTVRITVTRKNSEWISVSIWNRTPLPREIQEHFGAKYLTHGKKRGTGLGLYSARLMTETQGGTLTWSSSEEEGTTITVTLPAVSKP